MMALLVLSRCAKFQLFYNEVLTIYSLTESTQSGFDCNHLSSFFSNRSDVIFDGIIDSPEEDFVSPRLFDQLLGSSLVLVTPG